MIHKPSTTWQATLISHQENLTIQQSTANLTAMLHTDAEGTFSLPHCERKKGSGQLTGTLTQCARHAGHAVVSPAEVCAIHNKSTSWR